MPSLSWLDEPEEHAALGAAALLTHVVTRLTGASVTTGALAAAQLGVPVAAATLGSQLDLLKPGEAAALILGALVTIAAATLAGVALARAGTTSGADP